MILNFIQKAGYRDGNFDVFDENGNLVATVSENFQYKGTYRYYLSNGRGSYNDYNSIIAVKKAIIDAYNSDSTLLERAEEEKKKATNIKSLPSSDNGEFYPTPKKLVGMMIAGLEKPCNIKTILEPSAGKGDIADYFKQYKKHFQYHDNCDIECVEQDENLRYILEGKGYRVVFDDFLNFHTIKKYDAILMNPPFWNGCKHLLKAIEVQRNGGQICCILNAETIRNPYTYERQLLMETLKKYDAKIKFVSDAFKKAERKTDVEVAVIWVNIPDTYDSSEILEGLKRAEKERVEKKEVTDICLGGKIEGLISRFEFECKLIRRFVSEYENIKPYIMESSLEKTYMKPLIELRFCDSCYNDINDCLRKLRYKYWEALFKDEELMSRFTSTIREKYESIISDMQDYDFNTYNVKRVMAQMNAEIYQSIVESIESIFDKMSSEYSYCPETNQNVYLFNGWKTNKAHKVGMKAIIPNYSAFSKYSYNNGQLNEYNVYNSLIDIEKVLSYFDGKVSEDFNLSHCIRCANINGKTKNIYCKYFSVTFYKKGTMHIKIHPEFEYIIDSLNIYVCKKRNWLPPHYGTTAYEDMSEEEKSVIDDFQGKDKYEEVLNNKDLYLPCINTPLMLN